MSLSEDERRLAERHAALFGAGEAAEVIEEIARIFGVERSAILDHRRTGALAEARQLVYYVLRQRGWTLAAIGQAMGRDHSTVRHGIAKIEATPELRALAKAAS